MRLRFRQPSESQGSVLVAALFIACILGIGLGSCLVLVRFERDSAVRSAAWNAALTMAEGGIEEALAKLNPGAGAALPTGEVSDLLSRSLAGGSYNAIYTASGAGATIYATGYVAVPSISANLSRVVQVTATNAALLTTALAANGPVDLNESSLSTDSYDSADPNHSINGQYPGQLSGLTSTNGDVATGAGLFDAGYTYIRGDLLLGPNATSSPEGYGTVSGTVHHDFNVDLPDVVLPSATGWFSGSTETYSTNDTTYANAFFLDRSYTLSGLSGGIYVAPGAKVTLLISGNANVGDILIDGAGGNSGQLTIYMAGASFSVNGEVVVESGLVSGFTYFGLPGNTSVTLTRTPDFVGTIYAPEADLAVVNDGASGEWYSDTFNFTGSSVIKSMSVNGYNRCWFHYDENLRRAGAPRRGYLATAWQELP